MKALGAKLGLKLKAHILNLLEYSMGALSPQHYKLKLRAIYRGSLHFALGSYEPCPKKLDIIWRPMTQGAQK
jgi:hypothetical protein